MAVVIFDKKEELTESLLQDRDRLEARQQQQLPGSPSGGYLEPSVVLQGGSLEPEASSSLDSSRRTLNQGTMEEDREREFGGAGLIVELSKTEQSRRSMSSSDEDSIDKEQEDYKLLAGAGIRNMFINHSEADRTLPRPYNPG